MEKHVETRGYIAHVYYTSNSQHLKLSDLKETARDLLNKCLFKENVPTYPRPEFHVTHLKHDTTGAGLYGIRRDNGFRDPDPEASPRLVWWSLMVRPEDILSAETRLLEEIYPNRTEEQAKKQQSFLGKFATSPAFLDSSRLGSYRFTFPLEELLTAYSKQLCSGDQPVMRVFKTVLYKQEVMYVVLVHSPANQELFSEYPLLTDDPNAVCAYRDGRFIWRPEAMCESHRYMMVRRPDENQVEAEELFGKDVEYYVWDNVAVALHMEDGKVLQFDADKLRKNLIHCEKGMATITHEFDDYKSANRLVKQLWSSSDVLAKAQPAEVSGAPAP